MRTEVAAICEALHAMVEERWSSAAQILQETLPGLVHIAGSAAQRQVFDEALDFCLTKAGVPALS
jgi:HD-GYP domain-containing protein (c-di-GMP phosphodiesterase class II)